MYLSIAMQPSHLSNPSSSNLCVVCLNQFRKYKLVIFDSDQLDRDKLIGQQNPSYRSYYSREESGGIS